MPRSYYPIICRENPIRISIFETAFHTRATKDESFPSLGHFATWLTRRGPLIRENKRRVPLITRAACVGERKKRNLRPPFACLLDVDQSQTSPLEVHKHLDVWGCNHLIHTTWSHDPETTGLHSYRIWLDVTCDSWEDLEHVSRQASAIAALEPNPDSWRAMGLFVPCCPDERRDAFEVHASLDFTGRGRWKPVVRETSTSRVEPQRAPRATTVVDRDQIVELLSYVDNAPRETWIRVGMALRSSGLDDAREIWDEWSRGRDYPYYSDSAQEVAWRSFRGQGVGVGTLYHLAREGGWRPERATALEDFADVLSPLTSHLRKMNERYAFVWLGAGVVADVADQSRPVTFKPVPGFRQAFNHPSYVVGRRANGVEVERSIGQIWLDDWPDRRTYLGVDFLPENDEESLPDEILNTWRGWKYGPASFQRGVGSCRLFMKHVREVLCQGDEDTFRWIVAWMAHLVQRPHVKPGTALVLRGSEGVGKGVFGNALVELCGAHGVHVTQPKQLTGSFNQHLMGKLLIFADEVTWGGRVTEEGVLKGLITEKNLMVEPKGVDAFMTRNFFRVLISSNHDWVVPAGRTARRFQVVDVGDSKRNDSAYFDEVTTELKRGGYAALMRYLKDVDLDEWPDPTAIISTAGLTHQKIQSLDPIDSWIFTILGSGEPFEGCDGWPESISASVFYDSYVQTTKDLGANRRSVSTLVGMRLKKIFGSAIKRRKKMSSGSSSYRYHLAPLEEMRERFQVYLGAKLEWGEDSEEKIFE